MPPRPKTFVTSSTHLDPFKEEEISWHRLGDRPILDSYDCSFCARLPSLCWQVRRPRGLRWLARRPPSPSPPSMSRAPTTRRPEGSGAEGFLLDQGVFTTIDFPGAVDTLLTDITGRGKVLGFYTAAGTHRSALSRHPFTIMWPLFPRGDVTSHGFLLHHGVFMPFDVPGSMETVPLDFNGQREIVGGYVDTSSALHAFLLKDGTFSTIDVPGAADTQASGINSGGQIVGTYDDGTIAHGFLRQHNGTFTTIDVPGALHTLATSINGHGQIVGFYYSPKAHGFLLDQGVFTTIDVPGAEVTFPWKIKGKRIVGGYQDFNGFTHGFLATP